MIDALMSQLFVLVLKYLHLLHIIVVLGAGIVEHGLEQSGMLL
jgi:hypothetical protein